MRRPLVDPAAELRRQPLQRVARVGPGIVPAEPGRLRQVLALQTPGTAHAQPEGTLQKIKQTAVINLGGRDASSPFPYMVGADANPTGFSADL
jgi:hypothetical protein